MVTLRGSGGAQERSTTRQCSFASSSCDVAFHLQTTAHASSALPANVTGAMMGGPVCTCYFFHLASERYFGPAPCTVSSLFMGGGTVHAVFEGLERQAVGVLLAPPFFCIRTP